MSKVDVNYVVGLIGVASGMIGIGYALGTRSKVAEVSKKLDCSIDELATRTPVQIDEALIKRSVEKAVANEVERASLKATNEVVNEIKQDISRQVHNAIEVEYNNVKDTVLAKVTNEAAKIDISRVRAEVEKSAKERALKSFDNNLDDILKNYKDNLENVAKIYRSFADVATPSRDRETILKIV